MEAINTTLLLGALLLFISVGASVVSSRFGFPLLLVFLVVGMLAGEDGPGGLQFNDFALSFLIANLALALILLDGGLRTNIRTFRVALAPAVALATLGVVITAAVVGVFAALVLGFGWQYGLLFGAIVGSTDAAAVFALLRHSGIALNERVSATLEIESGSNDPMAIFLTIVLVELITGAAPPGALGTMLLLVQQLGLGAVGGLVLGFALREAVHRIQLAEGLYALFIASGAIASFDHPGVVHPQEEEPPVDLDSRVEYANRGLCQHFGYSRRELIGREWSELAGSGADGAGISDMLTAARFSRFAPLVPGFRCASRSFQAPRHHRTLR